MRQSFFGCSITLRSHQYKHLQHIEAARRPNENEGLSDKWTTILIDETHRNNFSRYKWPRKPVGPVNKTFLPRKKSPIGEHLASDGSIVGPSLSICCNCCLLSCGNLVMFDFYIDEKPNKKKQKKNVVEKIAKQKRRCRSKINVLLSDGCVCMRSTPGREPFRNNIHWFRLDFVIWCVFSAVAAIKNKYEYISINYQK